MFYFTEVFIRKYNYTAKVSMYIYIYTENSSSGRTEFGIRTHVRGRVYRIRTHAAAGLEIVPEKSFGNL